MNGVAYPTHDVGTAIYRLRVLNGSNARVFRLAMTGGMSFTLIGSDGGLLDTPSTLTEIVLAPAERVDLLVDFRDSPVGQRAALTCRDAGWDLLTFVVTHRASVPGTIPTATTRLSTIAPLADAPSEPTRSFRFGRHHEINGREYDAGRVDFRVQRGRTERWRFEAGNGTPHPVHVHGATFQVQSRQGGRGQLFPWERGWKDTVLLSDDEVVEVLIRFDKYAGTYLLHCHKLEHEDGGMMLNFAVD